MSVGSPGSHPHDTGPHTYRTPTRERNTPGVTRPVSPRRRSLRLDAGPEVDTGPTHGRFCDNRFGTLDPVHPVSTYPVSWKGSSCFPVTSCCLGRNDSKTVDHRYYPTGTRTGTVPLSSPIHVRCGGHWHRMTGGTTRDQKGPPAWVS